MLFKLANGKTEHTKQRQAVSYVWVTRYLVVKERAKITASFVRGRQPSWGDFPAAQLDITKGGQ